MKKIKQLAALLLAGVMTLAVFAGCGEKQTESGKKETLTMGLDTSFPPMGFRDTDGEIAGFDVDLAKAVAEKMGVELKLQAINWKAKETELASGKVDILWNGLTMNAERIDKMTFTRPYLQNRQVVVVRADSGIQTLADMKDKTIVLQDGSTAVDALQEDKNKAFRDSIKGEPTVLKENITCFSQVELKRADAVVIDEVFADYFMSQDNQKGKFRKLNETLADEVYGIAVKKDNNELRDRIQKALDELHESGKTKELCEKWFGKDVFYT